MADRVAVYLYQTFDPTRPSSRRWRDLHGWQREQWREKARRLMATIEAVAAADDKVISAGAEALTIHGTIDTRSARTKAGDVFAAMLFEAMEG